jgi:hypothetical protein
LYYYFSLIKAALTDLWFQDEKICYVHVMTYSLDVPGIEVSKLAGFAAGVLVSWIAGDPLILWLYSRRFRKIIEGNRSLTFDQGDIEHQRWRNRLDLEFGRIIGRIERIFYIYAVTMSQFTLLSSWVILKAFYGWIQKPTLAQTGAPEEDKDITAFYAYIYGNALSIMVGLACGHLALVVASGIRP